jgi:hypothetical protein
MGCGSVFGDQAATELRPVWQTPLSSYAAKEVTLVWSMNRRITGKLACNLTES